MLSSRPWLRTWSTVVVSSKPDGRRFLVARASVGRRCRRPPTWGWVAPAGWALCRAVAGSAVCAGGGTVCRGRRFGPSTCARTVEPCSDRRLGEGWHEPGGPLPGGRGVGGVCRGRLCVSGSAVRTVDLCSDRRAVLGPSTWGWVAPAGWPCAGRSRGRRCVKGSAMCVGVGGSDRRPALGPSSRARTVDLGWVARAGWPSAGRSRGRRCVQGSALCVGVGGSDRRPVLGPSSRARTVDLCSDRRPVLGPSTWGWARGRCSCPEVRSLTRFGWVAPTMEARNPGGADRLPSVDRVSLDARGAAGRDLAARTWHYRRNTRTPNRESGRRCPLPSPCCPPTKTWTPPP